MWVDLQPPPAGPYLGEPPSGLGEEPVLAVVGPAGVGKTRAVREWAHRQPVPPAWVDLQGIRRPISGLLRLAAVLGVQPAAPLALEDGLRDLTGALRAQPARALVLDGVDGLRGLQEWVGLLRRGAPAVPLVLTLRAPPEWPGVSVRAVAPLPVLSAVDLYERHAGPVEDPATLGHALAGVGQLPAAIELLAGLSGQVSERERARSRRPGALRDVVAAVWRRLPPPEREALVACAVFVGPFDASGFAAVTGGAISADALLRRGLLQELGQTWLVPDAVRAFVAERVSDPVRAAHARWLAQSGDLLGRFDEVIAALGWAVDADPRAAEALLAPCLAEQGIPYAAFEPLLDRLPPSPDAWWLRGRALLRAGRAIEAEAALELAERAGLADGVVNADRAAIALLRSDPDALEAAAATVSGPRGPLLAAQAAALREDWDTALPAALAAALGAREAGAPGVEEAALALLLEWRLTARIFDPDGSERRVALCRELGRLPEELSAHLQRAELLLEAGEADQVDLSRAEVLAAGRDAWVARLDTMRGRQALLAGEPDRALALARAAGDRQLETVALAVRRRWRALRKAGAGSDDPLIVALVRAANGRLADQPVDVVLPGAGLLVRAAADALLS